MSETKFHPKIDQLENRNFCGIFDSGSQSQRIRSWTPRLVGIHQVLETITFENDVPGSRLLYSGYVTACVLVEVRRNFGRTTHCLHLQGRRVSQPRHYQERNSNQSALLNVCCVPVHLAFSALKIEAMCSSEMPVNYKTAQYYTPRRFYSSFLCSYTELNYGVKTERHFKWSSFVSVLF
jgi:hypothetical protein